MRLSKGLGVIVIFLCVSICWAQNRLENLEKKVLSQQKLIEELETQVEQKEATSKSQPVQKTEKEYTKKIVEDYLTRPEADETEGPDMGYDNGFYWGPNDDILIKFKGEIMWQAFISEANTIQNNSIILRRNRLDTHLYFNKDWHARLRIGYDQDVTGNAQVRLREGYIEYTGIPFLKFLVGVSKVPFSMEFFGDRTEQMAIAYSPFLTLDSMPRRDAGVMIYGEGLPIFMGDFFSDYFGYALGIFNGDSTISNTAGQDTDGAIATNADDDFMIVAAFRFFPFDQHKEENKKIFFHAALFYQDTNFREDGAVLLLDGLRNHEVYGRDFPGGVPATEDVDDVNGDQFGVDLGFSWRDTELRIETEFMYVRMNRDIDLTNAVPGITADRQPLEMFGVSTAISYFFALNEEGMGVEPLFKFSFTSIEDRNKDTADGSLNPPLGTVTDITGQDIWEIVYGLRFHINEHFRLDFNHIMYDLKETTGFSNLDNINRSSGGLMHSFMFQVMARW